MRLIHHPETDRLRRAVGRCLALAIPWSGTVFRATSLQYANRRDVVTGEGSRIAGARFTPQGAFRTLYGSMDLKTALEEVLAHHRRQGLPEVEALPLTFVGLRVIVERVLDLRGRGFGFVVHVILLGGEITSPCGEVIGCEAQR